MIKLVSVAPGTQGFLFKNNRLSETLDPGVYYRFAPFRRLVLYTVPMTRMLERVTNQEVLTQDNIAFRFSFALTYKITEPKKLIEQLSLGTHQYSLLGGLSERIHVIAQVAFRNVLAAYKSEELNEKRDALAQSALPELQSQANEFGVEVVSVQLLDLTFPKNIQDLFAKVLEAKIRSQADLENARTAVAATRALKNVSELMKDDDNIRFHQFMEALTKIAAKGNHTFMIGDVPLSSQTKAKP